MPVQLPERKWITTLVEVKHRSWQAKILFACMAIERGYGIILGNKNVIDRRWNHLPTGIWFDKSITPHKVKKIAARVAHGFKIVVLDEEGLVIDDDVFANVRMSAETLKLSSAVLTWGKHQANVIRNAYPDVAVPLHETGNPRVDLWRPEFNGIFDAEVQALTQQYGDYILILSNFANYIDKQDIDSLIAAQRGTNIRTEADEQWFWDFVAFHDRVRAAFEAATLALAQAFPEKNIIIRPHPGDNEPYWAAFAKKTPANVKIIYQGVVTPWLLGAKTVVHNSCTTGLEALIMGKTPIAYVPFDASEFEIGFTNAVSQQVTTTEDLIAAVQAAYDSHAWQGQPDALAHATTYLDAIRGALATDQILDVIDTITIDPTAYTYTAEPWSEARHIARNSYRQALDTLDQLGLRKGSDQARLKQRFIKRKFPGSSSAEINALIAQFAAVSEKFTDIKVVKLERDLYALYR